VPAALAPLSGLLAALAFPWFNLGGLAWVSLAPFFFALRGASPPGAAGLGLLFGCAFGGVTLYWWFDRLGGTPAAAVLFAFVGFAAYYLLFGFLYSHVSRGVGGWLVLAGPALWVAIEYVRASLGFLAFPWNLLGHSQYRALPVIQVADLTGVYGISFLLVLINHGLSRLPDFFARHRVAAAGAGSRAPASWATQLGLPALALLLALGYGWHRLGEPETGDHLRIAVVQANLVPRIGMTGPERLAHLQEYGRLTHEAAGRRPDLIVWPSSSLPAPYAFRRVSGFVTRLARETETYLLVGGAGGEKFGPREPGYLPYSNSEFLISPAGRAEAQYDKIHLTPFDEYLPFQRTIRWPRWITSLQESYVAGSRYTLFEVRQARFGAPICWENMFADHFRRFVRDGARFMVSVTNEGFFGHTSAPYQTLAMNVFRAVENRVAVVRAATTGVSAVIEPNGRISGRVAGPDGRDTFVAGFLVRDIPLARARTFYTLYGDVFAYAAVAASVAMLLLPLRARLASPRARSADREVRL
jgi:apolipoprotein N-acyltransferase